MFGGDGNADGNITGYDKDIIWKPAAGTKGYLNADFNLKDQVENKDKNDVWTDNLNVPEQVPK